MTSLLRWIMLAAFFAVACPAPAADTAALAKRLRSASDGSSLDDPALKAWYLKLAVQLYDTKGTPSEQGTIEEWWTPDANKRVYTFPSYTATEIYNNKLLYRTKGEPAVPYFIDAALRFVVHPMVPAEIIDQSDLQEATQNFGQTKLDCIMLAKLGKNPAHLTPGKVPTFCLDSGADQLRVFWTDPEVSTRRSIGVFQGRRVGVDDSISVGGVKRVGQHIEQLDGKGIDSSIFAPVNEVETRVDDPVWVSATVANNTVLRKFSPIYPLNAKINHISGTVLLLATIGKNGHVISAEVLQSPDPGLSEASVTAVKQWEYTPYLANGVATPMMTTITVHYNFGPA